MSLLLVCPVGAAISDVVIDNCPSDLGQIQKVIFQRIYSTGTTKNSIPVASAPLLATWTALMSAVAGTKAQITPFISAPENESGGPILYGGGNDTVDGIQLVVGVEPSKFMCKLLRVPPKTAASLKGLYGETLGVYFVNEHGRIWGDSDNATTPTLVYPIPIRELFIGDRKLGGFQEPDHHPLQFNMSPNWSDKLYEIVPTDFDPLTDLAN
jgi:hypothetical protein